MHRRLLFKPVTFQRTTWLAMCLLVTSCGVAQEPAEEPTALRWPEGLITAIQANDLPAVKESLEKGAEVNARVINGMTPLMFAAMFSSTSEIVTLLLEKGAEIEARDINGMTPLMSAAMFSSTPEIVTLLLAKGAEIEARDKFGSTPLLIAAGKSTTRRTDPLVLERRFQQLSWHGFFRDVGCYQIGNNSEEQLDHDKRDHHRGHIFMMLLGVSFPRKASAVSLSSFALKITWQNKLQFHKRILQRNRWPFLYR